MVDVQIADAEQIVAGGTLVDVLIVVTEEDGLFPAVGLEASQDARIDSVESVCIRRGEEITENIGLTAAVEASSEDRLTLKIDVLITIVRMEIPTVGKQMVSGITHGTLIASDMIVVGLAKKSADADNAVGIGVVEGAISRKKLAPFAPIVLIVREDTNIGTVARMPSQRWRDESPVVWREVRLSIAVSDKSEQSVTESFPSIE